MTPSSWQQQAFAMDARVNALRAAKHPNFRKWDSLSDCCVYINNHLFQQEPSI